MSAGLRTPYAVGGLVYLRPLDMEDAEQLIIWINDRAISQTLEFRWPMSRHQEEDYIQTLYTSKTDMTLGIGLQADNRLIGCAGLHGIDTINRRAAFGVFIGDTDDWGHGYGTDATRLMIDVAFERLNLRRLELDVHDFNPGARRVYDALGFQLEGVRREHTYWQGRYRDTHLMGLLRSEYQPPSR